MIRLSVAFGLSKRLGLVDLQPGPGLYAYAWGCTWNTAAYVSWNGATEISSCRVFGGMDKAAQLVPVADGPKEGFETDCERIDSLIM